MQPNQFQNYSFSNSLKNMFSPFGTLLKKPQVPTVPGAPQSTAPAMTPLANASTPTGPKYFAPPVIPQVKPATTASVTPVPPRTTPAPITPAVNAQNASGVFTTPSGSQVNAQGQLVSGPATPQISQNSTPGTSSTPETPIVSPEAQKAYDSASRAYEESLKIGSDELATQEDLDRLAESTKKAYLNTKGQAIPLEFITGQLKAVEERSLGLAEPLERKLARIQAQRQSSSESSKFAFERAEKRIAGERETGLKSRELAESTRRFGIEQEGKEKDRAQIEKKFEEDKRQFGLEYALKAKEVAIKAAEKAQSTAPSAYQLERTGRIVSAVDELMGRTNEKTTGLTARVQGGAFYPGFLKTDAYVDYGADLETLRSNIAFSELQAMREASKTGGALGQVAIRELELLESTLGAINQQQSPENLKKNLQKIKDSLARWNTAISTGGSTNASAQSGGGSTFQGASGTTYKLPY